MNNKLNVVLGIDIGGTNTAYGIVDFDGKIIYKNSIPTNSDKQANVLFQSIFNELADSKIFDNYNLTGVGVGAPNANHYTGKIENPPNLGWEVVDVKSIIKKLADVEVDVTNDANAAAYGEYKFGAAKDYENFIQITLGTGLGSGIIVNGELVYGKTGSAAELGHITLVENGRKCGCGRLGCLEAYASATGIKRTALELLGEMNLKSRLSKFSADELNSKLIYDHALEGDFIALRAFQLTAKYLARAMADATAYLSPEAIIIFGGLANAGNLLLDPLKQNFEENVFAPFKNTVKIIKSSLPEADAAILGAAAIAINVVTEK